MLRVVVTILGMGANNERGEDSSDEDEDDDEDGDDRETVCDSIRRFLNGRRSRNDGSFSLSGSFSRKSNIIELVHGFRGLRCCLCLAVASLAAAIKERTLSVLFPLLSGFVVCKVIKFFRLVATVFRFSRSAWQVFS